VCLWLLHTLIYLLEVPHCYNYVASYDSTLLENSTGKMKNAIKHGLLSVVELGTLFCVSHLQSRSSFEF